MTLLLTSYSHQRLQIDPAKRTKKDVMAAFTPRKHALLEGEQVTVPRHKRRKLCKDDDVPGVSADDVLNASLLG